MQVGIIGLGRMGSNIAKRLMRGCHDVVVFNRSEGPVEVLASEGATVVSSLEDMADKLAMPRIFWSTLSAGASPESTIETLVSDSGEGQWTIDATLEEAVPAYVLSAALFARYGSRVDSTFGDKLLWSMRLGFGGHVELQQK